MGIHNTGTASNAITGWLGSSSEGSRLLHGSNVPIFVTLIPLLANL
jgi:hypothetical protein